MLKLNYLAALIFSFFLVSCQASNTGQEQQQNSEQSVETDQDQITVSLEVDQWNAKMQEFPGVIIDVRTPGEFEQGYIEGAHLADVTSANFVESINALDIPKDNPVYVYCRSGSRSKKAMSMLESQGFTSIYELNSGIMGWQRAGKATVKP